MEGIPAEVSAGQYQTRVIVRDVTGKYTWDSALLYGPDRCTYQEGADSFMLEPVTVRKEWMICCMIFNLF